MAAAKVSGLGFVNQVIAVSLIILLLCIYPVSIYATNLQVYSIVSGYIIALLNALIGYKLNTLAINKSVKSFMVIVFGSMGLRMMFIAILLLILIYFAKLDELSVVGSVFFFYIVFTSIEIIHLHKNKTALTSENKD
ncbi:MAG TPA: hypothetical protein VGK25_05525 [Ignavibacteria bacterium]|jgi:hypothetical protein